MKFRGITPILLVLAGLAGSVRSQNYVFGPNTRVNDDPPGMNAHSLRSPGQRLIAARGDTVYITWLDRRPYDTYYHVYFARSNNGGRSFGPNLRVDSNPQEADKSSLAVDDSGRIHISWRGWDQSGRPVVSYSRSDDGGQHFTVPIAACESSRLTWSASIAVSHDGRRIYVARDQGTYPHYNVFLSRSTDGGQTFSALETRVNDDTIDGGNYPAVCVFDDTIVMVAWHIIGQGGARFARSLDGGATFGPSIVLDDTAAGDSTGGTNCSAGVDSSGWVYVVFYNRRYPGGGPRLAVSEDTGRTFLPGRAIPAGNRNSSLWVAADGRLFLTWDSFVAREYVKFSFSPDRGATFFPRVDPTDTPSAGAMYSSVAANQSGEVFVAWEDGRDGYADIYLAAGALSAIEEVGKPQAIVEGLALSSNPSRGRTTVRFVLRQSGAIEARVFDLAGRQVRALTLDYIGEGYHSLTWDGCNSQGKQVCPGVYFIRVEAQGCALSTKFQYLGN